MTQVKQQRHKTKTRIWHALKKKKKSGKHQDTWGERFVRQKRAHGWEMKKMSCGWSGADKDLCWEESRGKVISSISGPEIVKNIWPTDGTQWWNFPCCFPPEPPMILLLSWQTGESMNISACLWWKGLVLGDELTLGWQDCGGDAAY